MPIVVTLDQRASRTSEDLVPAATERLNDLLGDRLTRPFVRTAGDEMQAVLADGGALADLARELLGEQPRRWWVGVGLGAVDDLGETARDSTGPAFWHAREAVNEAKNPQRAPWGIAVRGEPAAAAENLRAGFDALAFVLATRSPRQREAVEVASRGETGTAVARRLGITPQSANELLRAAAVNEQRRLEGLIGRLAAEVVS